MAPRECGPCAECCYALGVHELNKVLFSRCRHEKHSPAGCCGVYKTRPTSCAEFSCLWLGGQFGRKERPDRVGIVFATAEMAFGQVVFAYVRKPGADTREPGSVMLRQLAQQLPVCILRWDGTRAAMFPEHLKHLSEQIRVEMNAQAVVDDDGRLRRLPLV